MDLVRDVELYVERHQLLPPDATVVVGVSGGPDSVALLHILGRIAPDLGLKLHVAHLNHRIRGQAADGDEVFVAQLAASWGLDSTTESLDIPALAEIEGLAIEETARRARYAFLCRVAQRIGARQIAVGHNADDQAETVLMHLLRGSGPAGLRGMLPRTPLRDFRLLSDNASPPDDLVLIRPLLNTPREAIEAYCRAEGLHPRFDRSNLDTTYYRNKLRHEVLPYLREINPQISERLQNLAEVIRADYNLLEKSVGIAYDALLTDTYADARVFDLARWREQPLAIRRALVRRSAYLLRRSLRDVSFQHVEQAVQIAQTGKTGDQAILPDDLALTVGYTTLTIGDVEALHLPTERPWLAPGEETDVTVPGTTPLHNGWHIQVEEFNDWNLEAIRHNPNPLVAWLDAATLGERPVLRTRQEGDRFQPQGMGGASVRLSDYLINIKLPLPWRDHLPLLANNGTLLWVVGFRLSHRARVRRGSQSVVCVRLVETQHRSS